MAAIFMTRLMQILLHFPHRGPRLLLRSHKLSFSVPPQETGRGGGGGGVE